MTETGRRGRRKRRLTKDRVLQARIPEQLDEEIRDRAEQLGVSVSTVVRNVLLHTFELVEGVVSDSAQVARVLQGHKPAAPPLPELPAAEPAASASAGAIIGWQEAVLNLNGICEQCNTILARGERAAVGMPVQARPQLLCLDCLAALAPAASQPDPRKSPADTKPAKTAGNRKKPVK